MQVVTGATGHIGNVLIRELLNRGHSVRAVVPPGEDCAPLEGLKLELVHADVRELEPLVRAFAGADVVFHLAGIISISPGKANVMHEVNVVGARNVVQACRAAGVRRLVYTSSVHAFEDTPRGTAICETLEFDAARVLGDYGKSKARATQEVIAGGQQGLDAVIVFPSGVTGPYDFKISEMGQLVLDFCRGRLPVYIDGAYDFVDVRDVAAGLIAAGERGRIGEGYLLSGETISVREIISLLQKTTGIPAPRLKLPYWLAQALAFVMPLHYRRTGAKPRFTSYSLRVLRSNCQMDNRKARRELGYSPRPIRQSITDSYNWFKETGRL